MRRARDLPTLFLVLVICLGAARAAPAAEKKKWKLDLTAMPGYHSNYLFRGEGAPAPDSYLTSFYSHGRRKSRAGRGKFTFLYTAGYVFVLDIDNASYYDVSLGGQYKLGANKFTGSVYARPNQVFDEEGGGVLFDVAGARIGYRRSLRPGMWIGLRFRSEQWDFDSIQDARDSTAQRITAAYRFPLGERAGLRVAGIYEDKSANSDRFSYSSYGGALSLEAQPGTRVVMFARYQRRQREYKDAPPGNRNFEREDTIQDVVFNLTWWLTTHWGLRVEDFYRDGGSSRRDRNYSGNRLYAGAIYRF